MGRPSKYERTELLDKALMLFWQKGFKSTSMQALTNALNVHPGTLYETFGDKNKLFEDAFDRYLELYGVPALSGLRSKKASLTELDLFFYEQTIALRSPASNRGCLVTIVMSNPDTYTPEVTKKACAYQAKVENVFRQVLRRAVETKKIRQLSAESIKSIATILNTLWQGIRVEARSKPSAERINELYNGAHLLLESLK